MSFEPNIDNVSQINFRPYMIECAFDYYSMAVNSNHTRMGLQSVMCALSLEVILKSFNVSIAENDGGLHEEYNFDKSALIEEGILPKGANVHDLIVLYESIPLNIQEYLFESFELGTLRENRKLFINSRYVYEKSANKIHNDDLIKLTARVICKMLYLYKKQGCSDFFIEGFDIDKLYFSHTQPYCS
jgi:hypothetical protein